jgi:hypothetical protein
MSKQLDSILNTMPPATASTFVQRSPGQQQQKIEKEKTEVLKEPQEKEKQCKILAIIPYSLKREIKQYLVDRPGETEKTVVLRGLMSMGFSVSEEYLSDWRGKK